MKLKTGEWVKTHDGKIGTVKEIRKSHVVVTINGVDELYLKVEISEASHEEIEHHTGHRT